jgi:hypothetical protein
LTARTNDSSKLMIGSWSMVDGKWTDTILHLVFRPTT